MVESAGAAGRQDKINHDLYWRPAAPVTRGTLKYTVAPRLALPPCSQGARCECLFSAYNPSIDLQISSLNAQESRLR